nr:FtsX-like permease family protein [Caldalkalibacillus mannanilyticus]
MSIYERTREIGIMKVIGASINNIRTIFLIEAGIIGLVGGVVGLMIGWISAQFLNVLANLLLKSEESMIIVDVPWWLGLFVILFSTAVGVLSGLYPALRAAKLSALDAIRHN